MNEKDIETLFADYAESRGCRCLKLSQTGRRGWPDRTVFCPTGEVLFVEFKTPTGAGKLSRQQKANHEMLRSLGFRVLVTKNFLDAKTALDETLENAREWAGDWLQELEETAQLSQANELLQALKPPREWHLDRANDGSPVLTHDGDECPVWIVDSIRSQSGATAGGPELPFEPETDSDDFSDLLG